MSLELYSTKESSDTSELPKNSPTSVSLAALINKMPAIVKGDFIGRFDSEREVGQYIEDALLRTNCTLIDINFPSTISNKGDFIVADFSTTDGVTKSITYFLVARDI